MPEAWAATSVGSTSTVSSLSITAPATGVDAEHVAILLMQNVGNTLPGGGITVSGDGVSVTELVEPVVVGNMHWGAWALTGLENSTEVTVTLSGGNKVMSLMMRGYETAGVGNLSDTFAKPGSQNTITLPAFTAQDADSLIVDLWAERNSAGETHLSVSTGTIREQFNGSGSNTGHTAISDREPGSTTVGSVVGTYTSQPDGAGSNRNSADGGGIQVEILPPAATTVTGSGTVTAPAATTDGAGTVTVTGAGTPSAPAASTEAAGTVTLTGSGAVTAPAVTGDGDGTVTVTGSAAVTAPAATASGSGGSNTGSGEVTAPAATVSGSGSLSLTGDGEVTAPAATADAAGTVTLTGSGAATAAAATADGSGTLTATGSAAVTAPAATAHGSNVVAITPPSRTVTVRADSRTLTVPPKDRTRTPRARTPVHAA